MGRGNCSYKGWGWGVRCEEALASLEDFGVERGKKWGSGCDERALGSEGEDPIVGRMFPRVKGRTPICGQEWVLGLVENVTVERRRPLVTTEVPILGSETFWIRVGDPSSEERGWGKAPL